MHELDKAMFRNRTLCCYEYTKLDRSQEEDMFQRVQRGISLNAAEKMRAYNTPWAKFARVYEKDFGKILDRKLIRTELFHSIPTDVDQFVQPLALLHSVTLSLSLLKSWRFGNLVLRSRTGLV